MTPRTPSDADRARRAGRLLRWMAILALAAHLVLAGYAWFEATGLPLYGSRRNPGELASVIEGAISRSVGVLTLLTLAILVLSGWRRPRPPGAGWRVPWEWPLAAGAVVVAALLPLHGPYDPTTGGRTSPAWTERACATGVLVGVVAALVVLQLTVAYAAARGPRRAERREGLRDALALWGFLLLAGALLVVEGRTMGLMLEIRLLGPRSPAWGSLGPVWLEANRLPLAFAFAGLVAAVFGALHLRRPGQIVSDTGVSENSAS